jgi:rubrerythrin
MDLDVNLDRHLRGSRRLDLSGVEWERIREYPLADGELRCLVYMMDIESHTMVFLRDLLATRAVEDPLLTSFLAVWCYEELWHGEALSRFLGEAGIGLEPDGERPGWNATYPSRTGRTKWVRRSLRARGRVSHVASFVGSALSADFPAVHMAWGAVNELSTMTAYERMIARTSNPVLADVLHRIVRDERRHYSFYRVEAERRLAASASARRLTRLALRRLWAIVGTGVRPQSETDFVVVHLFGDDDGIRAARGMDAAVDRIPGLGGLQLFERARIDAFRRSASGD